MELDARRRARRAAITFRNLPLTGKAIVAGAVLFALWLLWSFGASFAEGVGVWRANRADRQSEQKIEESVDKAETHKSKADGHATDRAVHEAAAERARERKLEAAKRSRAAHNSVERARRHYEKVQGTPADDVAPVADSDICAELARRNIPCR